LVQEVACRTNWAEELRWERSVAEARKREVGRVGAQEDEVKGSRASTSRGDAAGKQLRRGEVRAFRLRWAEVPVILIGSL